MSSHEDDDLANADEPAGPKVQLPASALASAFAWKKRGTGTGATGAAVHNALIGATTDHLGRKKSTFLSPRKLEGYVPMDASQVFMSAGVTGGASVTDVMLEAAKKAVADDKSRGFKRESLAPQPETAAGVLEREKAHVADEVAEKRHVADRLSRLVAEKEAALAEAKELEAKLATANKPATPRKPAERKLSLGSAGRQRGSVASVVSINVAPANPAPRARTPRPASRTSSCRAGTPRPGSRAWESWGSDAGGEGGQAAAAAAAHISSSLAKRCERLTAQVARVEAETEAELGATPTLHHMEVRMMDERAVDHGALEELREEHAAAEADLVTVRRIRREAKREAEVTAAALRRGGAARRQNRARYQAELEAKRELGRARAAELAAAVQAGTGNRRNREAGS
jgi:hypothetical protein